MALLSCVEEDDDYLVYITKDIIWDGERATAAPSDGSNWDVPRIFGGYGTDIQAGDWTLDSCSSLLDEFTLRLNGDCHFFKYTLRDTFLGGRLHKLIHISYCYNGNEVYTDHNAPFDLNVLEEIRFELRSYAIKYKSHMQSCRFQVMQLGVFLLLFDMDSCMEVQGIALGVRDKDDDSCYVLSNILWAVNPNLVRVHFLYHAEKVNYG